MDGKRRTRWGKVWLKGIKEYVGAAAHTTLLESVPEQEEKKESGIYYDDDDDDDNDDVVGCSSRLCLKILYETMETQVGE
ncbi:hypothetical protein M0804_006485 [Polistes exclamans]|nr:hypothetical protein M0804_006485 [Polistes exclamans]